MTPTYVIINASGEQIAATKSWTSAVRLADFHTRSTHKLHTVRPLHVVKVAA